MIKYDVIGLAETRRRHPFNAVYDTGEELFLGTCDSRGVNTSLSMNIDSFEQLINRIGRLRLKSCGSTPAQRIFVVYAPTSNYDEEEVEAFYMDLERFYREDLTLFKVIIGDFNAKIGPRRSSEERHIGTHGLERNEQGSPEKPARRLNSSPDDADSIEAVRNSFEKKLPIYADNMRKLIITARKEMNDLRLENTSLKQKLQASGLIECPACLFRFKPEREHRVLPKYIKVLRGKLSIEIEFSSLEQMSEWLTLNKLDENADGLPTMVQLEDHKPDLKSTGSLVYKLVKEKQEFEAKNKKVVISIRSRPRDECTNASASSSSSDRLLPRERIMTNSAAQGLSNVSKINCLENKCSNDSGKEDIKESFTSSHLIPKNFNNKHNQGEAQVVVQQCHYPELHEANQHSEVPSITKKRIREQGKNYDRDEAAQVCGNELNRMKNDGGPAANDTCGKIFNKYGTHVNKGEEKTNGHQYPRKNDSSEWISNSRRTHVDEEEETMRRQSWRTVSGKENASGMSSAKATCNQVNVHEINCKNDVHVTLEKYSPRSSSKSLSKPMHKIGFSNEDQNDGIRIGGQYSKVKNENEISDNFSNINAAERVIEEQLYPEVIRKIDVDEKTQLKGFAKTLRDIQQIKEEIPFEACLSFKELESLFFVPLFLNMPELCTTASQCSGYSKDNSASSRTSQCRHSKVPSYDGQHVGRNPADGEAKSKSPLRSPREKRRKRYVSPLRKHCRNVNSVKCDTAPIPTSDLIVVDEEDVEDGEIVE
uniref:Reverse transcriptase domain-containing protein n=1 Tax=Angiostrongylus cantonensis TaxID=6313 RepID=A0A0K0DKZ9_ANGCA